MLGLVMLLDAIGAVMQAPRRCGKADLVEEINDVATPPDRNVMAACSAGGAARVLHAESCGACSAPELRHGGWRYR